MKIWTKQYTIVDDHDGFHFIFKEWLFFGCSLYGEFLLPRFDDLFAAEKRLEEILNPKDVELL